MTKQELIIENQRLKDEIRELSEIDDWQRKTIAGLREHCRRLTTILSMIEELDKILEQQRGNE